FLIFFLLPLLCYAIAMDQRLVLPVLASGWAGIFVLVLLRVKWWRRILQYRPYAFADTTKFFFYSAGLFAIPGIFLTWQLSGWTWQTVWPMAAGVVLSLFIWNVLWTRFLPSVDGQQVALPDRLQMVVAEAAPEINIPMPKIVAFDSDIAKAQGDSLRRRLCVSTKLLEMLEDDELATIIRDALRRMTKSRSSVLASGISFIVIAPLFLVRPMTESLGTRRAWLGVFACGAFAWWFLRIVADWEQRRKAPEIEPASPALVRALEKLHRHNCVPAVIEDPASHPDLRMRFTELDMKPDWPEPAEARKADAAQAQSAISLFCVVAAVICIALLWWIHPPVLTDPPAPSVP
ncbi:MAG TPA: hypothetical protein VG796_14430, partial [Verrucomicrobiales bacterium]|nr:hypothetical protein [Verrucomicrobiales bacterium]